jgi:hypothetical protein
MGFRAGDALAIDCDTTFVVSTGNWHTQEYRASAHKWVR